MTFSSRALTLLLIPVGGLSLWACGSNDAAPSVAFPPDGGGQPCARTTDCDATNQICVRSDGAKMGECIPPTGGCDPTTSIEGQCYPDARCDTASTGFGGRGNCSFQAPSRDAFPVAARIALETPLADTEILPGSGFSFRWEPPAGLGGAIMVALVMTRPPVFDPVSGRISNRADVAWAWSTAEPNDTATDTAAVNGTVPVRFGHRGVNRDGSLGAAWGRDTMDTGQYWWFVYAIAGGEVTAASVAQRFVVAGTPARPTSCFASAQCVGPGDLPELAECYQGQCRRRCASDLDCRAVGTTCALTETLYSTVAVPIRRGAFCATVPHPMTGDGGLGDGGPP